MKEGLYEQVINKEILEELNKLENDKFFIDKEKIEVVEAKVILTNYVSSVIRRSLDYIREKTKDDKEKLLRQIELCNRIISILSEMSKDEELKDFTIDESGEILNSLYSKINNIRSIKNSKGIRPVTPLSQSSLFTGASVEPNMLSELKKEILTSDSVDLLVSFIKWSGIRCIINELMEFVKHDGKRLRIITTSYMGATDPKAIVELSKLPNTEIKISYDTERTRLHAKAYMFKRDTGFTTAYIGSSNLSNAALTSGLEWNLKVTEKDSFDIIKKFDATFESYWNDSEFIPYLGSEEDKRRLEISLRKNDKNQVDYFKFTLDIRPYSFQKEILDRLSAERELFNRNKNLVIAATGVGKTVISAFDYKNYCIQNKKKINRLLFVAHREEILIQSRNTFRAILKDNNFGDLMVGGNTPKSLDHLFVSIQSLNSKNLFELTTEDFYDFIIVDEFHHAAAPSYQQLLNYYKPEILLGLTATPERADGEDIFKYFDDRISAEIRLPEAIDRKLLSPFQYFGITDVTDLSRVKWGRKGYDIRELDNLYTNNDIRASQIIESLFKYVTDVEQVVGLGFCVSVEHAKYMANYFNNKGIPSIHLHGNSNDEDRKSAKERLVNGEIKFIFVVDLYNEGVDIPEINTILFLRPTESLTVFLQQLGRGLRLNEGKECLTVLDFVGQAHKNYNFEYKFRALIGRTNHSVKHYLENGFLTLPKGCYIELEKQAKEYILRNIKQSSNNKANLINKLKTFTADTNLDITLENFLNYHHLSLIDFYGKSGDRSFSRLLVIAGIREDFKEEQEINITKKLKNIFYINSRRFIEFLISLLKLNYINIKNYNEEEKLMINMLYYSFFNDSPIEQGFKSMEDGINNLLSNRTMSEEIIQILSFNYKNINFIDKDIDLGFTCPLDLHCEYTSNQIMSAFSYYNENGKPSFREGVKYFKEKNLDVFFITLNKSDKEFSPSTLYEDYAINEKLFHWQSQSTTSVESITGRRYLNHKTQGSKVVLFVREGSSKGGITSPYIFLGKCEYLRHEGSKPISIIWRLEEEIPPTLISKANKTIVI